MATATYSEFNGLIFICYVIPDTDQAEQTLTPIGGIIMEKASARMLSGYK
jgi:hypothetical protein